MLWFRRINVFIINIFISAIKPVVQCSFITEFEDHIFVTVDAEAFFFLHDLITSYVKEKERVVSYLLYSYINVCMQIFM